MESRRKLFVLISFLSFAILFAIFTLTSSIAKGTAPGTNSEPPTYSVPSKTDPSHSEIISTTEPLEDPNLNRTPCIAVFWTKWFSKEIEAWKRDNYEPCTLPQYSHCILTSNRSQISIASAIVFHARDVVFQDLPQRKLGQPWVLWTLESPRADGWPQNLEKMRLFDKLMTYNLDSDIPYLYFKYNKTWNLTPEELWQSKRKDVMVAWVASNCYTSSGRESFISQLKEHIPVHCYGSCLNNRKFPKGDTESLEFLKEYKFYLSMENANCKDYVTEKLFRTLDYGIVPVADGPEDYSPFLPSPNAIIRVDDFDSPKALAEHLLRVGNDEKEYLKHFDYRYGKPLPPLFEKFVELSEAGFWCGFYQKVMEWAVHPPVDPHVLSTPAALPDRGCLLKKKF